MQSITPNPNSQAPPHQGKLICFTSSSQTSPCSPQQRQTAKNRNQKSLNKKRLIGELLESEGDDWGSHVEDICERKREAKSAGEDNVSGVVDTCGGGDEKSIMYKMSGN